MMSFSEDGQIQRWSQRHEEIGPPRSQLEALVSVKSDAKI